MPGLVEVREVAVVYHLHQDMFYHMVQDQYYRLFALLPYLHQHPDIHILLYIRYSHNRCSDLTSRVSHRHRVRVFGGHKARSPRC